jgi:cytochrome P450
MDKYTVLADSTIMMSQYLIHHDPRYYNEPDRFAYSSYFAQAELTWAFK